MAPPAIQHREFLGMPAVFASRKMIDLLDLAGRVARSGASVLIQGESGCGKELVARAIHQLSLRCHKPWVDISCGALPEHLMESELFGYERGAFSGADCAKPGLFELAHGGTLFLDEIGELDARMQVKLLRVLDGASYFRLGGTRKVQVDVRIVAATNAELELAAAEGRFRRDLYHRLSQVTLRVPPLRERIDDISVLAEFFLAGQDPSASFAADALACLNRYHWPGNVRELRNVITRAAIFAGGDPITAGCLALPASGLPAAPQSGPASEPDRLDGIERHTILRVLEQSNGHRQRAADTLGISRRTLSRKLKLYRIDEPAGLSGAHSLESPEHERQAVG
ncbi:MAG: sigma-54-dependent Fis family transcriptional regulator [Acidobacteria bacterium]|nr:sigma-54-dependent Fis family transcriptional regulator [Acidobacteriota bacterium]